MNQGIRVFTESFRKYAYFLVSQIFRISPYVSACENLAEFSAESGCKANDLTLYNLDTVTPCCVLPYI